MRAAFALTTFAASLALAAAAHAGDISPDGRWRATIRPAAGPEGASGEHASALWLTDTRAGTTRLLFKGRPSREPRRDTVSIARPNFSLDGGYIYVEADAYVTSPAIHQVNVRTGAERFVVDGGLIGVIRTGPWRGFLIVQQHRYHRDGKGSFDPVLVYRPDGKQMALISTDDDKAVRGWLRERRWTAS